MNIAPSTTNAAVADILEGIDMLADLYEPVPGASAMEHECYAQRKAEREREQDAIAEAAQRLRELRGSEDEAA